MRNDVHYTPAHWTKGQAEADYKNQPAIRVTVNDRAATRQAIITSVKHQQVDFYERSDWGAHKAKPVGLENDWDYTKIAIHMAGRSYSCGKPDLKMEEIQEAHQKNGRTLATTMRFHARAKFLKGAISVLRARIFWISTPALLASSSCKICLSRKKVKILLGL